MTRGLYPPDTLSKDDVQTLAKVRRDIYYNAVIGGAFGAGTGFVGHTAIQWAKRLGFLKQDKYTNSANRTAAQQQLSRNKNTLMLSVLGGGALGMFLFAVTTGKEQVHNLHDIFQIGAVPQTPSSPLDRQQDYNSTRKELQENRLTRRRTLMDGLKNGHGLNDAHGGHWYTGGTTQQKEKN